ncbi:hypothetical protein L227DRAFT_63056 [Lentinus tigrinus ALCF2SS1-6]|uniref:Uncharacterized protein n=1 Tax=Lentinus tigrinus ALCF2SS1-6 TaxID=1328759 RepID=A0A5C2SIK0_9APHY|nr:hypothetical protein L227DRAFT_63056 [Lentinus tigrinus ALCF2SS1-6]
MPNLLSSLRTFFRRVLGLPMTHNDLRTLLDVKDGSEDFWFDHFEGAFITLCKNSYEPGSSLPPVSNFCISEIALKKKKTGSQHEFVHALIRESDQPDAPIVAVLKCERCVSDDVGPFTHARAMSSNTSVSSTPSSQSLRTSIVAHDKVVVLPLSKWSEPSLSNGAIYKCKFTANPPSLTQLAVAVYAIHQSSHLYTLHEKQCYWFAATLFRILLGHPFDSLGDGQAVRDMIPGGRVRAGTFWRFIRVVDDDKVEKLYPAVDAEYRNRLALREQELQDARGMHRALAEARAREEEAKVREEEAKAREEQARAEAEEAKAQVAAMKKMMEQMSAATSAGSHTA